MVIIEGVEVAYFRSIYKQKISKLKPCTVYFGRNDAGKSNFLRALNLFFNNKTDAVNEYSFDIDFCKSRANEAQEGADIRRFLYVKVFFKTPAGSSRSLGASFYVKRTWNPYGETSLDYSSHIKHERFVTQFLNKIEFHYIPAVKDRNIFSELLLKVYGILSSDEEFRNSLGEFSNEIQRRTEGLSEGIFSSLELSSAIAPPNDISTLFGTLDFETKRENDPEQYSLIRQRGDGVQARHILELLRFVSDHSPKPYHIWGLEEPENSLELSAAIQDAKRLMHHSEARTIQTFVTSHSPAFYNMKAQNCSKFFINKESFTSGVLQSTATLITSKETIDNHKLMNDTVYLRAVASEISKLESELEEIKEREIELSLEIQKVAKPVLYVEGKTDVQIIEIAWSVLFPDEDIIFDVKSGRGVSGLKPFWDAEVLTDVSPTIFVLVDYDGATRNIAKNLKPSDNWKKRPGNCYWATYKPTSEAVSVYRALGYDEDRRPITLENMFPSEVRNQARLAGMYEHSLYPYDDIREGKGKTHYDFIAQYNDEACNEKYYLMSPTAVAKENFPQWLEENKDIYADCFEVFRENLEGLKDILKSIQKEN